MFRLPPPLPLRLPCKVVQVNDDIDRMRHSATRSLLERRDVIVVASVCASHLEAQALANSRFV